MKVDAARRKSAELPRVSPSAVILEGELNCTRRMATNGCGAAFTFATEAAFAQEVYWNKAFS